MNTVKDFIEKFKNSKVANSKIAPNAISDYLYRELEIKTYIPFRKKRAIVEKIVDNNLEWVDGIKKYDNINSYMSFVVAMLSAHTNLVFSSDPVADYDLLSESGLLPLIIEEFRGSYDECDSLFKMVLTSELEDNNINAVVGRFLNGILNRLDSVGEVMKSQLGSIDIQDILGDSFKQEDLTKLKGFLDKINQ